MSRFNDSGAMAMGALAAAMFSVGMSLAVVACGSGSQPSDAAKADAKAHVVAPIASVGAAVAARSVDAMLNSPETVSTGASATPARTSAQRTRLSSSEGLVVKRFVVTEGIRAREPLTSEGPLSANGKPIFAFAELSNESAGEARVRITFERQGSSDRVGNVALSVPAKAGRFRTWGQTRFVREAGTWDAVLWSDGGKELGRTSFEVVGS